jgi:hypothetical protein
MIQYLILIGYNLGSPLQRLSSSGEPCNNTQERPLSCVARQRSPDRCLPLHKLSTHGKDLELFLMTIGASVTVQGCLLPTLPRGCVCSTLSLNPSSSATCIPPNLRPLYPNVFKKQSNTGSRTISFYVDKQLGGLYCNIQCLINRVS